MSYAFVRMTAYETIEFERADGVGWLRLEPARPAQLVHDRDVARDARARPGAPRRPRPARRRRDRQRPRVLVGHRHDGVHVGLHGLDRRRRRRGHAPRRSDRRRHPAHAGGVLVARRRAVPDDRGRARLRARRGPAARARVRHPRVRARHAGRPARAQVRDPARPRRHAAAAARRRREQGEGADLDRGAHRRRGVVPHRPVRPARRRSRSRRARSRRWRRQIAAQPPLAVQGAKRAVDASARLPLAEGLVFEAEQQRECLRSDDMREAITAFVEQRAPDYKGK